MNNNMQARDNLCNWKFGKYVDKSGQQAYLGIHFMTEGVMCKKPLILPLSDYANTSRVMKELVNTGADINPLQDIKTLEKRIQLQNLVPGKYAGKLGWFENSFLTPHKFYGLVNTNIVIQPKILDAAEDQFECRGEFEIWREEVLELAEKSSFLMFAIMMALASILQSRVFGGNEEGFIINFCGATSRGKTTALAVAKSFSGDPEKLLRWDLSPRNLAEAAAAASDTLLTIDDLDSIADKSGFGRDIAAWTHMLASGRSRSYSVVMRDQLPDLYWTCCALTCGKESVEKLSLKSGHVRSQSDKVRMMDIPIPSVSDGGIWDDLKVDDNPSELTQSIRDAVLLQHGTALPIWLGLCFKSPKLVDNTKRLINRYIEKLEFEPAAGMEHRIAKKFGLIYAAGILGCKHHILPWNYERIYNAVLKMHELSMRVADNFDNKLQEGLGKVIDLYNNEDECRLFKEGEQLLFRKRIDANCFILERKATSSFYITIECFYALFTDEIVARRGLETLKDQRIICATGSKSSVQKRVKVNGKVRKFRYLKIDADLLLKAKS